MKGRGNKLSAEMKPPLIRKSSQVKGGGRGKIQKFKKRLHHHVIKLSNNVHTLLGLCIQITPSCFYYMMLALDQV